MGVTKILMKEEIRTGIDGLLAKFYGNPKPDISKTKIEDTVRPAVVKLHSLKSKAGEYIKTRTASLRQVISDIQVTASKIPLLKQKTERHRNLWQY